MQGSVSKNSFTANVDQSLGDVIDLLDDHLNFGAALHFEASHDRWGVFADAMYLDLEAVSGGDTTGDKVETLFQEFLGELGGFYSIVQSSRNQPPPMWNPRLDLLAGARVYALDSTITPPSGIERSHSETWIDPILGVRGEIKPLDWLSLFGRGDIGGFGLDKGTFSNFSWNVLAGVRFDFTRTVGLSVGYRWLDVDYENPSENFDYDIRTSGPFTALEFRF